MGDLSRRAAFLTFVLVFWSMIATAQSWRAASEVRDVWWVDEETTAASSAPKKSDPGPDVVSLDDSGSTASEPAKTSGVSKPVVSASTKPVAPKAGSVSDLLTGRNKSVSAKATETKPKPTSRETSKPKAESAEVSRSARSRVWVNRTGSVVSVQPVANNNLQVIIETADGTLVEGLVSPHIRVRVPDKGSRVRLRGPIESLENGTETMRVFELERVGPRMPASEEAPVRRPGRLVPPPPTLYPVW
jgi:hypothetical protein